MSVLKYWQILLIILWAFVILASMFLFSQNEQASFDPSNELLLVSMSPEFENIITESFRGITGQKSKRAFHIVDKNCSCTYLSKTHMRKLDDIFLANGFDVQELDVFQYPTLSSVIPSVPAIVIFDKKGKLGYLGPYSSGFFCNSKTSIIESIANSIIHNRHIGPTVISDSKGCYCNV